MRWLQGVVRHPKQNKVIICGFISHTAPRTDCHKVGLNFAVPLPVKPPPGPKTLPPPLRLLYRYGKGVATIWFQGRGPSTNPNYKGLPYPFKLSMGLYGFSPPPLLTVFESPRERENRSEPSVLLFGSF